MEAKQERITRDQLKGFVEFDFWSGNHKVRKLLLQFTSQEMFQKVLEFSFKIQFKCWKLFFVNEV